MTEDMPSFWWCPTHHLYRGGDERPCADAVRLVPAPPAPRVFLPGDMVPEGVATVMPPLPGEDRAYPYVMHEAAWDYAVDPNYPVVELPLPSAEDVRAAIEQAQVARSHPSS